MRQRVSSDSGSRTLITVAPGAEGRLVGLPLEEDVHRERAEEQKDAAGLDKSLTEAMRPGFEVVNAQGQVLASGLVGGDAVQVPAGNHTVRIKGRANASKPTAVKPKETATIAFKCGLSRSIASRWASITGCSATSPPSVSSIPAQRPHCHLRERQPPGGPAAEGVAARQQQHPVRPCLVDRTAAAALDRLFTVRGERPVVMGVHAAVFAALARRIRAW